MKILKNIIIFIVSCILSYNFAGLFGNFYLKVFPYESAGSFINGTALIGLPLIYIFSITLLFIVFGDQKKYWWITIALLPAALFEVAFDLRHIYFPIAIGLIGWGIGRGVEMGIKKYRKV